MDAVEIRSAGQPAVTWSVTRRLLVVAAALAAAAIFIRIYPFQIEVSLTRPLVTLPLRMNGWEGSGQTFSPAIEKNLGVSEYLSRDYQRGGDRVNVYMGYYRSQRAGEQIHSPKHCLPGGGLEAVSERVVDGQVAGYGRLRYLEALYKRGNDGELFIYWYRMRDEHITNEYLLKLAMIWNSLVHRRNEALFVRLSTHAGNDEQRAQAVLERFMGDFLPVLATLLPR